MVSVIAKDLIHFGPGKTVVNSHINVMRLHKYRIRRTVYWLQQAGTEAGAEYQTKDADADNECNFAIGFHGLSPFK